MSNTSFLKALSFGALFFTATSFAQNITILNHNFEHDAIPPSPGWTTSITGWVNSGLGEIGVTVPIVGAGEYTHIGGRAQVAYLNEGGRISQTASTNLLEGEIYTLTYDIGQSFTYNNPNFVARIKSNGEVLAQQQVGETDVVNGQWVTHSLSLTASSEMPIGNSIVVEFQNLATTHSQQIHIDNIKLSIAGTGSATPGGNLGPLTMIMEDTTLLVPGQYPNIHMALKYLDDKHIKVGKTVTIQVTDCTNQVYTQSINVAHPNGSAIHIVGNIENPESCVLQFDGSNGFEVTGNFELGLIGGFHIAGDKTEGTSGVISSEGGRIEIGNGVHISGFEIGLYARENGKLFADYTRSYSNKDHCYLANQDGFIRANYAEAFDSVNGFFASNTSLIVADYAKAHDITVHGFFAGVNSNIRVNFSSSYDNKYGYKAHRASEIFAQDATAYGNSSFGFLADFLSLIDGERTSSHSNNTNYSPAPNNFGNKSGYIIK